MNAAVALLIDAARRPVDTASRVLQDIDGEVLHTLPQGTGNSIAWLIWHAARQMDYQLAGLAASQQVWQTGDWRARTGIERGSEAFGFGDRTEDVAQLRVRDAASLHGYLSAVVDALCDYLTGLTEQDLDEVIDTSWDPPVTRGVRLVSLIDDAVTHLGQACYARGLLEDWRIGF